MKLLKTYLRWDKDVFRNISQKIKECDYKVREHDMLNENVNVNRKGKSERKSCY